MTIERYREIRMLFEQIIELNPAQQSTALMNAHRKDPELAAEVEALITAHSRRGAFIEHPIATLQPRAEQPSQPGTLLGAYALIELVGLGGMGEVWRAEQKEPVRRQVAVKLIKAGMDTREVLARFEAERQALALMDHPAIARVFDAGWTPQGRPFFVMEFVSGSPITAYCDRKKLSLRERVKLFIHICEGVQHAHQRAIIHRDLKPSNILITEFDGRATPKIIDFGVARATGQRLTAATFFTLEGAVVGTPDYMSPEQACLTDEQIDTRSDVYSLGVLLYELLAGALPLELRRVPFDEVLRRLREDDPPRPSARVKALVSSVSAAANRGIDAPTLGRQLRHDLDCIALKALAKKPSDRYGTPTEFAADLNRFLRGRPVEAHPPSLGYQAWKYFRRHYVPVTAAALLLAIAAIFFVAQGIQLRRVIRERDRADRIAAFMSSMFKSSTPAESRGSRLTVREVLDKAAQDLDTGLTGDAVLRADMMDVIGDVYERLGMYPQSEAILRRAVRIHSQALGPKDLATARSLHFLSATLYSEGRLSEAEKLERDALRIRERKLGPEHPETLRSTNNIARILTRTGALRSAEKLHRYLFETRRRLLGPENPDTLVSMDNLASVLDDEGHYVEAEALEREALAIKSRTLGQDHPETLRTLHHLADTEYSGGRYVEAEKLHREELALSQRVLGPEHASTLNAMVALANALDDEGRYSEAETINRRALEIQLRVLGAEHYDTLITMNNEAEILSDQGRYAEAAKLHRRVLEIRTRVLGANHSDTLYSMSKLAWSLSRMKQLNEAEELSRLALAQQIRVLGADHPDTADTRYTLACIAVRKTQRNEALRRLDEAVHHGLKPRAILRIAQNPDWDSYRNDPRYKAILAFAGQQASGSSALK